VIKLENFAPKRRVLAALLGGKVDRVPVSSVAGCGGIVCVEMQKTTGICWPEAHKDPEKMAKLAIAACKLTGLECVRVPFDFVVEPEALGCEIKWYSTPESVPAVSGHPYEKPEDLKMPEDFLDRGRIPVVLEAITLVRKEVGDFFPISSLALGPFSLSGELAGMERFVKWIVLKPDYVKQFVNFVTDIVIEYAKAQYRAGSDIVQVADPMASGDVINVAMFREFVKPALIKIANSLGGIKVLHICGRAEKHVPDMVETGFDGISIEEIVDISRIKPLVGNVKILGNVSSKKTLIFGSPSQVKEEARKALEAGVDLLEPGCGISPITPLENIKALVEAVKEFKSNK
jgi:[methyl-Co(III) methanol-specific corrinoid protein]:coenzyme M methyltransferase